jgi:hypothetical protein
MTRYGISLAAALFLLAGCTTTVQTNPPRTATEELLISTAAEHAAERLALSIPHKSSVFVDSGNFEGTDSKYAIATIRTSLLKQGIRLTDDRKKADVIVETRAGALSTDRKTFLIGVPSFNIPIPLASAPLSVPQIALYGTEDQRGVAKFAVTAYDAKKGNLVDAQDPQFGFSHNTQKTVLFFITWTDSDAMPKHARDQAEKGADHSLDEQEKAPPDTGGK